MRRRQQKNLMTGVLAYHVCCSFVLSTSAVTFDQVSAFQFCTSLPPLPIFNLWYQLLLNLVYDLTPCFCLYDISTLQLKFASLISRHLHPSTVLAVQVSTSRCAWMGIVASFVISCFSYRCVTGTQRWGIDSQ